MAPSSTLPIESHPVTNGHSTKASKTVPLSVSGALDRAHTFTDITPAIGREYSEANIVDDLLNAPNADELVRDLAITISERGVVFFRAQDNLTNDLQKKLILRLGELSGRPSTSTLHVHPVLNNTSEFGVGDHEISTISSAQRKKLFRPEIKHVRQYDANAWHSDIQFEPYPADYTSLRLVQLPSNGGDTLWASGYDIYDRLSPPLQSLLDRLTATFIGDGFLRAAQEGRTTLYTDPRGAPENVGAALTAVHPVIRTNPVTGWKSVYSIGNFPKYINELHVHESDALLKQLRELIVNNHDLQVRFKWRNVNDIAIWDNRSAFHAATFDYDHLGERFGNRVVGIGERPYFDGESRSKAEALFGKG